MKHKVIPCVDNVEINIKGETKFFWLSFLMFGGWKFLAALFVLLVVLF